MDHHFELDWSPLFWFVVSVTSSRIAPSCLKSLLHLKSGGAVRCCVNRAPCRAPKTKLMGADARRRRQQTQRSCSGAHRIRFESRRDPGYRWMCAGSVSCSRMQHHRLEMHFISGVYLLECHAASILFLATKQKHLSFGTFWMGPNMLHRPKVTADGELCNSPAV